jgi:HSP20 family protein
MANLTRYDPFSELDDLFRGFVLRPVRMGTETEAAPQMKIEVKEDDKAYSIHAEIPGAKKEDIKVTVDGNEVAISAEVRRQSEKKEGERVVHSERYYGKVYRAFTLDSAIDDRAAQAKYNDGVLELTLPKKAGGGPAKLTVS